jgi:signal peptidase II
MPGCASFTRKRSKTTERRRPPPIERPALTDTPASTMPALATEPPISLKRIKIVGLVVFAVLLAADLASKAYMQDLLGLTQGESQSVRRIEVIDGFLAFEGTWNPGVTFGIAPGQTTLIMVLTICATLGLLIWFLGTRSKSRLLHIGLAMILSGAVGNLYDRVRWHEVRDFILMYLRVGGDEHKWPNYNVADAAIVVGVGFIIWDSLFGVGAKEAKAKDDARKSKKQANADAQRLAEARQRAGDA